jgi:hypothetical protein
MHGQPNIKSSLCNKQIFICEVENNYLNMADMKFIHQNKNKLKLTH